MKDVTIVNHDVVNQCENPTIVCSDPNVNVCVSNKHIVDKNQPRFVINKPDYKNTNKSTITLDGGNVSPGVYF